MKIDFPSGDIIPSLKALWQEAFGDTDEYIDTFFDSAYDKSRCLIAEENGEALGAVYWLDCSIFNHRIAYFYAIATKKSHRGKGICSRLMNKAHSHLASLGYSAAILVPGSQSLFDFYGRMGYKTGSYVDEIAFDGAECDIPMRKIDGSEYARLRREYLPENGVIQENEHIKYLEIQANLYTGADFLLSCRREGDTLVGIELLGNTAVYPYVIHTLGCKQGMLRTPGVKKPFAMYYSLKNQTLPAPFYFGLAFD